MDERNEENMIALKIRVIAVILIIVSLILFGINLFYGQIYISILVVISSIIVVTLLYGLSEIIDLLQKLVYKK